MAANNFVTCPKCNGSGSYWTLPLDKARPYGSKATQDLLPPPIRNPCPLCFANGEVLIAVANRYWKRMKDGHE